MWDWLTRNTGEYLSGQEGWIPGRGTANKAKEQLRGGDANWVPEVSVQGGARNPKQSVGGVGSDPTYTARSTGQQKGAQNTVQRQALPPSDAVIGGGGGAAAPAPKVLDEDQLRSLDSLLATLDTERENAKRQAELTRNAERNKKRQEKEREEGKYQGKKLETLQEFGGAKTETDLNVRNTIENLLSSISTMNLGGAQGLTRQVLAAANRSNRQANATQATDTRNLDSAWNDFSAGNENDLQKIEDQFGLQTGEADRQWGKERQNTLQKKADVYNAADRTEDRSRLMREADSLDPYVAKAAFLKPVYDGKSRAMATPELADYTQNIAQYDTAGVGAEATGQAPAGTPGGNLSVRAIAVNDKDLGIKKKTEGDLGYGV